MRLRERVPPACDVSSAHSVPLCVDPCLTQQYEMPVAVDLPTEYTNYVRLGQGGFGTVYRAQAKATGDQRKITSSPSSVRGARICAYFGI